MICSVEKDKQTKIIHNKEKYCSFYDIEVRGCCLKKRGVSADEAKIILKSELDLIEAFGDDIVAKFATSNGDTISVNHANLDLITNEIYNIKKIDCHNSSNYPESEKRKFMKEKLRMSQARINKLIARDKKILGLIAENTEKDIPEKKFDVLSRLYPDGVKNLQKIPKKNKL